MQNVVLTVHLILALLLTVVVLLQRSEGGGLGMGGGSNNGVMSGRSAANAMTKMTWALGIALFLTSVGLTVIAARDSANSSIMDRLGGAADSDAPIIPGVGTYTPPPASGDQPLVPPTPTAPATTAPAPAEGATGEAVTPPTAATEEPATQGN